MAKLFFDNYRFNINDLLGGLSSSVTSIKFIKDGEFEVFGVTQQQVDDAVQANLLTLAKGAKKHEVRAWADKVDLGGFEWNGHTWDSDDKAQRRIPSAVISGIDVPYWMNKDNEPVAMTAQDMKDLHQAMINHVMSFHGRKQQMKDEVMALTTADEVNAYVVGW